MYNNVNSGRAGKNYPLSTMSFSSKARKAFTYWQDSIKKSKLLLGYLASCFDHLLEMNTRPPLALRIPSSNVFFNYVLQLIFSILRNTCYYPPPPPPPPHTHTHTHTYNACNSRDVDVLKFQLVHHDTFYNGQIQQDSSECLLMLIDIINNCPMPDSSSTTCPTGASLSDISFSFVLEKYIVCGVCGLRSPSFESSSVLYITLTYTSARLGITKKEQKLQKSCSWCNKNTWHVELSYILQPPKYLLLIVNRLFRYTTNNVPKDRCSIPTDATVMLVPLKFSLLAIIGHHGLCIHSGHCAASINYCKQKTFYCHDNKIT